MPQLQRINLDLSEAETDLANFRKFLQENATFSEREVLAELKKRPHLCCLVGSLRAGVPRSDVYKFEFRIQGVFWADLVVGNLKEGKFVFVEFEPGETNSLFGPSETNQMRDWSRRLEHGFGQLVDWAWAIQDNSHTRVFKNAFERDNLSALYLLVCGRDATMNSVEKDRFFWRGQNVTINGNIATCLTYDGLLLFFESTLEAIKSYHR